MKFRHVLITGGAGFVGSNLACLCRQHFPNVSVSCLDNLRRRGSEFNLERLKGLGIGFLHGDVRCREDLEGIAPFDLLIDCSAEPSVHAGTDGTVLPLVYNNLTGTVHCMEAARRHNAAFLFLSTSRVYPIDRLNSLGFEETPSRFTWTDEARGPGISAEGITEDFPLRGPRSFYGATKLAAELLLQEYADSLQLPVLIDRCGLLAGPWQMGKVDQGVITLWVARHLFGRNLSYTGFGGYGKQVRDLLHIEDLFDLIVRQASDLSRWDGRIYNIGGGRSVSTSLRELTQCCQEITGQKVAVGSQPHTSGVDVRIYLTDASRARKDFGWAPQKGVSDIVADIFQWLSAHVDQLRPILSAA
jgi:CDP-paratose 2-epimerase